MSNPVDNWTDARYFSFIRSALRKMWLKYPNRFKALNAARLPHKGIRRGKRVYLYECASCGSENTTSNVTVDHIKPCGSLRSYDDLTPFCSNLLCDLDGLQVLCKKCHHNKTLEERGINPEVAAFRKLKAGKQKERLVALGLREGNNAKERIAIFEESIK